MQTHWDEVYTRKAVDGVSWFRPHLDISLRFVAAAGLPPDARIVDVGGGAATLVDDLLDQGFRNLAVLDLAAPALAVVRQRLGTRAAFVDLVVGDATEPVFPDGSVDFWHDRAVFHFLTDPAARDAYLEQVRRCVRPGGRVLVSTFAPDGPTACSGLPVQRYDADGIHAAFGGEFVKLGEERETHRTPWGSEQAFAYCFCRRS